MNVFLRPHGFLGACLVPFPLSTLTSSAHWLCVAAPALAYTSSHFRYPEGLTGVKCTISTFQGEEGLVGTVYDVVSLASRVLPCGPVS